MLLPVFTTKSTREQGLLLLFSSHVHVCKHARKRQGKEDREGGTEGGKEGEGERDGEIEMFLHKCRQKSWEWIGCSALSLFLVFPWERIFEPGVCSFQQCWLAEWPGLNDLPVGTLPYQCWVTDEESHVQFYRMLGIHPQVPGLCIKNLYAVTHLLFLINALYIKKIYFWEDSSLLQVFCLLSIRCRTGRQP